MSFPIYIPSKGRPECRTARLLTAINYWIVVEPQDFPAYYEFWDSKLIKLPNNNCGLWFSRQFIKELSISRGEEWHWQIDDDIRSFLRRSPGKKSETISAETAISEMEGFVAGFSNIGQAGTNQNSWPPTKEVKWNNLPVQCVLNRNSTIARYRRPILDDMDYTLQVLREGFVTVMFDSIRTNCPAIGTIAGGLSDVYKKQDVIEQQMREMCDDFGTMTIDRDEKGSHLRRNRIWSTFKQRPIPV